MANLKKTATSLATFAMIVPHGFLRSNIPASAAVQAQLEATLVEVVRHVADPIRKLNFQVLNSSFSSLFDI